MWRRSTDTHPSFVQDIANLLLGHVSQIGDFTVHRSLACSLSNSAGRVAPIKRSTRPLLPHSASVTVLPSQFTPLALLLSRKMVFCFPSKRLRMIFSDDHDQVAVSSRAHLNKSNASATPAPTTPVSSHPPSATQLPPVTIESEKVSMKQPRIAIIIYSMYGHIASSKSSVRLLHPNETFITFVSVAEAVKSGVEKAGGNATIYQYVLHFNFVRWSPHEERHL